MKINYGIVALDSVTKEIVHFVGFENKPTLDDMQNMYSKIDADPEFARLKNCQLRLAHPTTVEYFKSGHSSTVEQRFSEPRVGGSNPSVRIPNQERTE